MQIRPIKTKADHRAALNEIERLMDAKPGTPAGDRLEILATLVDHYESQHEPIEPPDPIDALLYHMESRGLTRRDLEPFLGSRAVQRSRICGLKSEGRAPDRTGRPTPASFSIVRQNSKGLSAPESVNREVRSVGRKHGRAVELLGQHDERRVRKIHR